MLPFLSNTEEFCPNKMAEISPFSSWVLVKKIVISHQHFGNQLFIPHLWLVFNVKTETAWSN